MRHFPIFQALLGVRHLDPGALRLHPAGYLLKIARYAGRDEEEQSSSGHLSDPSEKSDQWLAKSFFHGMVRNRTECSR